MAQTLHYVFLWIGYMSKSYNSNLRQLINLTKEMLALADEGDRDREDNSCGIIYGVLRDCAYKLRTLAEQECEKHKVSNKWDFDQTT